MTSEPQLIIIAKAKDKNAVGKLHQRYFDPTLLFLLSKFKGQISFEDAQDAYQEAFISFLKDPMSVRASTDKQFFCWIKTVCTHYIFDLLKSADRRKRVYLPQNIDFEPSDDTVRVEAEMLWAEEWARVTSEVDKLQNGDKELFHLLRQGKSLQDIASDIGISYENARQRKHRLIQRIQGLLKK